MYKALMIAPTPFFSDRGCHVRIYEQVKALQKRGHEVVVLTYPIGNDPPGVDTARTPRISNYNKLEAGPSWHKIYLDALLLAKAFFVAAKYKPDVIHAHLHEGCLIGYIIGKSLRVPLLFDYQGSMTSESEHHGFVSKDKAQARALRKIEGMIDSLPDAVITSAEVMAKELAARGLRARAMADHVDSESFRPGDPRDELRRGLSLPQDRTIIVYLGLINEYQGVDLILKAAGIMAERKENVHFLVMGYPLGDYPEKAVALGVEDHVTFTGRVNYFQARDYLNLGDLALAPKIARTESNGKVLNYMACGLPVVAFDTPLNRELLGESAAWAKLSDDQEQNAISLARGVSRLVHDADLRDKLGREGRQKVMDERSMDKLGEKLTSLYRELIEERR